MSNQTVTVFMNQQVCSNSNLEVNILTGTYDNKFELFIWKCPICDAKNKTPIDEIKGKITEHRGVNGKSVIFVLPEVETKIDTYYLDKKLEGDLEWL